MKFNIKTPNYDLLEQVQHKIDFKTKPIGSLGILEKLAVKIACIQNTLSPQLRRPSIMVFVGDHGIAQEAVSPYPQEVTRQMLENFISGGTAINVFSTQNNINLQVIDAGINCDFKQEWTEHVIDAKIACGTKSYLNQAAMTSEQFEQALQKGVELVEQEFKKGTNIIGFGEMGIANTSSSAILLHLLTKINLKKSVGRGTGWDDEGLNRKYKILKLAVENYTGNDSVENIFAHFGGFEMVMIAGGMLKAAELRMIVMIDGFITSAALLAAVKMNAKLLDYCIFAHQSNENGHQYMLDYLQVDAILNLGMRLGEGTGVAIAYPIIESAVCFLNQMASFEEAGVSNSDKI